MLVVRKLKNVYVLPCYYITANSTLDADHLSSGIIPVKLTIVTKNKQPSASALKKRCSENMQQIYRRTLMLKCDFNKFAMQIYWNHISAWVSSCKTALYFQNTFS